MSWKIQNKKTNQFLKSPDWSDDKVRASVDSFWVDSGETLFEDLNEAAEVAKRLDLIFGERISKIVEV
jgi:hypothetical protein